MRTNKILVVALAATVAGVMLTSEGVNAQTRRQKRQLEKLEGQAAFEKRKAELDAEKARNEQHKRRVEQLSKEGWRVNGSRTLEVALLDHYKADPDGNKSYTAEVGSCRTVNLCQRTALTQAQNYYAQRASAQVKGRIGEVLMNQGVPKTDIDKAVSQYGTKVDAQVGNVLTESYTLVRERNGAYESQTAFIVDAEKATTLRLDAMKQSLIETRIVGMELDEIFKAVGQDVNM